MWFVKDSIKKSFRDLQALEVSIETHDKKGAIKIFNRLLKASQHVVSKTDESVLDFFYNHSSLLEVGPEHLKTKIRMIKKEKGEKITFYAEILVRDFKAASPFCNISIGNVTINCAILDIHSNVFATQSLMKILPDKVFSNGFDEYCDESYDGTHHFSPGAGDCCDCEKKILKTDNEKTLRTIIIKYLIQYLKQEKRNDD